MLLFWLVKELKFRTLYTSFFGLLLFIINFCHKNTLIFFLINQDDKILRFKIFNALELVFCEIFVCFYHCLFFIFIFGSINFLHYKFSSFHKFEAVKKIKQFSCFYLIIFILNNNFIHLFIYFFLYWIEIGYPALFFRLFNFELMFNLTEYTNFCIYLWFGVNLFSFFFFIFFRFFKDILGILAFYYVRALVMSVSILLIFLFFPADFFLHLTFISLVFCLIEMYYYVFSFYKNIGEVA